ncbi:bifunctional oligoribonuclease/PAP phosphatase NrnA [Candidatus Omnitrophota bacterium]
MSLSRAIDCIRRSKSFLVTVHANLEADALGSELAFYRLLKGMGKSVAMVNADETPEVYKYLPGAGRIKKFNPRAKYLKADCFAALDCSDLSRCAGVLALSRGKKILNIDHHISNRRFGDVNWVDPHASSCAEMIYRLYKKMRRPMKRDAAMAIYSGILTDTGSFRYTNTSAATHKIAGELMEFGLDANRIYKQIYSNIPYQDLKLLLKVLPSMKLLASGKLVWFAMKRGIFRQLKDPSFDLGENVLSFGRSIKGVEVVALFKENMGPHRDVRVNLRSQGKFDVNKIARYFGGGGHKTASGCTIKGNIDSVSKRVLAKIKEYLK